MVTLLVGAGRGDGLRSGSVRVMSRNVYVGANIFRILEAQSPADIPVKVAEILDIAKENNPPERFEAIADEIAKARPHLIGLQEVYKIRIQSPGDFFAGNPTPAEEVLFDYLELLLAALEERGQDYRVASSIENVDVELPGFAGVDGNGQPLFFDGRVTDRDVILVRNDVETANAMSRHYTFNASLPLGGSELTTLRGFTSVDAWVHGRKYRFVDTHLEVDLEGPALALQSLQAQELLVELASVEDPVIVVGDFNSGPDDPVVAGIVSPYRLFASAGYVDAWAVRRGPAKPGYTCCHNEFLNNPEPTLDRRIDLVWVRNAIANDHIPAIGPIQAIVVGDEVKDLTPSGQWPSDHAGVVARMRLQVPR
jgi:endonuclease/exonuclease/phosphatase family metal-dependent hydrolase